MRQALNISIKEKKKMMRDKRQKFEKFRNEKGKIHAELDKVPDISVELGPSVSAKQLAIDKVEKETREIWDSMPLSDTEVFKVGRGGRPNPYYREKDDLILPSYLTVYEARSEDEKDRD